MKRLTLVIFGRVQGVFFRNFVREEAERLGVSATVENNGNGTVTVEAEGEEGKLRELVARCKVGPPHAFVERVEEQWKAA